MNIRKYYPLASRWIAFLFVSCLCEVIAGGVVVKNWSSMVDGSQGIFLTIGVAVIVFGLGMFGLLGVVVLTTSRVILSDEGIQYQTFAMTMESRWEDLCVVFWRDDRGKHVSLHSSEPDVRLRHWARYAPWDVKRGACGIGIPISELGGFSQQRLLNDIRQFAPHLNL